MKDCIQNLLILFLIIVLIFSITRYIKNKEIKKTIKSINNLVVNPCMKDLENKTIVTYQQYTPSDIKETTIIYPINNNVINEQNEEDLNNNHHEYIPDENVIIIEEQNNDSKNTNNFNYDKEFSNELVGYDPENIFPSI